MAFACGKKKNKQKIGKTEMDLLREKFRFNENEFLEFKRRFSNLTKANKTLDRDTFRENMGLLGLDSGSFLADRIFAALDVDKDGYIQLQEYLKYFDVLIYGSSVEKYALTFRMIDLDAKGWFTYDEFKEMILSMLYTWNNLTGSNYNINQNLKLENFLTSIFERFDIEGKGKVTSKNFTDVVARDPQLLDIFNHFNQGIVDSVQPDNGLDQKDQAIIDDLEELYGKLNHLKAFVGGRADVLELPKDESLEERTGEFIKPPDSASPTPKPELKTPIVSSLDSKIRRTIFFEPFKEEQGRDSLKPMRQQSDIGNRDFIQRKMVRENTDYQRRWSHQPNGQTRIGHIMRDDEEMKEPRREQLMDKFKSMDVIYQEGNSSQSIAINKDAPHSIFRKEKEKENQEEIKIVDPNEINPDLDTQNGPVSRFKTINTRRGNNFDENGAFGGSFHNDHENIPYRESDCPNIYMTPPKRNQEEQAFSPPDQPINSKQLHLKVETNPLKQKVLDPDLETPDPKQNMDSAVGSVMPRNINTLHPNVELVESVLINSKVANLTKNGTLLNGFPLKSASPGSDMKRISYQSQLSQVQAVTEQLETLATETLRIIEEIRNKKKEVNKMPNIDESQRKETMKNIHKLPSTSKDKKGNYVLFGHQNWNLVLNMMLGIQMAVKSVVEKEGDLSNKDFNVKYIFELVPKRTSETKLSYKICTFFDYAPVIFYELRRLYGIKNEDYLRAIGPEAMLGNLIKGNISSLSELTSTGKSGSFFYYSADGKYTLKTISRDEFHFLREILKNYYTHMINNPQSLIIKFFGLHKIRFMKKSRAREKVYFIIMANVFHTFKEIHVRYDLKGSTKGRYTKENDPSVAKKDLNIILTKDKIMLNQEMAASFVDIMEKDSRFFETVHTIDYSLLMGVHYLSPEEVKTREGNTQKRQIYDSNIHGREGILSSDNRKLYFFGIIDILTHFNAKKRSEYVVKRLAYGKGISAVPPKQYAERFRKFIKSLVVSK